MIHPIIHPSEVKKLNSFVLIDARGGGDAHDRYLKGHIENALYADLDLDLSQKPVNPAFGGRHPLPELSEFGKLLGKLGITPSTHVVVYDDKGGANAAARFWWMMRSAGHEKVQVVDGGLDALVKEGAKISLLKTHPNPVSPYPVRSWKLPTAAFEAVEEASVSGGQMVIDVREAYRYKGESEPIDLVAGHIPGAINLPYVKNLDENGSFKSEVELRNQFSEVMGEAKPENVIVHCGSGVTACHTLLAMELAGLSGSKLYVGSWGEWSRRGKPIAKGGQL